MNEGLVIFTVIETLALVGWLGLTPMSAALAIGVLLVGLFLEHVVALNNFKARSLFNFCSHPLGKLVVVTVTEVVAWVLWLMLLGTQPVVAAVVLFVLLAAHHVTEINTFLGDGFFVEFPRTLRKVLTFTAVEVVAGVLWITIGGLQGTVVLLLLLAVEHIMAGKVLVDLNVERAVEKGVRL